jgi:hypothetical protein
MIRCWPVVRADRVGFRWPTVATSGDASSIRASSPRTDQGGSLKTLMQADSVSERTSCGIAPQSGFDCRRLAPATASANPTTPASAGADCSLRFAPAPVPSSASADSADAGASHVLFAPTRSPSRRRWSAYADDSGRSEFPLEPPSFAARWWAVPRPFRGLDLPVVLQPFCVSQAFSGARRHL